MVSIFYLNKHFNFEKITMLKIRTFILALGITPLLAINWQLPSQSQTSPSLGTAGSMSGGGTTGPINTSPSVGTAGGMSGGGNTGSTNTSPSVGTAGGMSGGGNTSTSGNTVSNPNPSVGNAGGQSGAGNETANNGNPDDNTNPSVGNAGGQSGAGNETANNGNPDDNTNPSVGNAGGQSGAGNETANNGNPDDNTNPSVGNAGGQSGAANETGNNANNGGNTETGNNNEGNNNNPSGPVENLVPRASSLTIFRTKNGNTIRIKIGLDGPLKTAANDLLNRDFSRILVATAQGGSIGQSASDTLAQFLIGAGVNPKLAAEFAETIRLIIAKSGDSQANVDINKLNNAINEYNRIIGESSPVTLQTLSQNQDFVAISNALKELRAAVK
jgi:hypothetical protein